ncbi:MAG TPA: AbrB/MazE/SpoVT family DNA-binding domain-containing protein [Thermoanaerobaculia bacterium]|nr:AbrB/MazE/SpoVT family DNA-binding domain-containing protein [Thermoanaerobaculia bacterium]
MPTATLTTKGQITLPREVREHLHVGEGDRVEFEIGSDGKVQVRPVTGSADELFGVLRRPDARPRSIEEMDEGIAALAREEDKRVRRGKA